MAKKNISLKRKLSAFVTLKSKSVSQESPWTEIYIPETIDELAVHKKKVSEVEAWFQAYSQKNDGHKESPMLLLTGPPGAGKTATVKTICKTLHMELFIWSNSHHERNKMSDSEDFFGVNNKKWVDRESQATLFSNFILRSTRYSLFPDCKRVILIEEFPNAFFLDASLFHNILRKYTVAGKSPIVFIVSDSIKSENIENRLFPKDLQIALKILNISFNPVAPTMLVKVLNRINNSLKNGFGPRKLSKIEIENTVADSLGDVRHAINCMQFLCTSKSSESLHKKTQKFQSVDKEYKRDCPLFLFHALGKVLYCKRDPSAKSENDALPNHMKDLERDPLKANPEEVYEKTSISAEGFSLFLQENYLSFLTDINLAAECSLWLSEADRISAYWNGQDALKGYMYSIATRGLMFNLTSNSSGNRWRPFHKPQHYENTLKVNKMKSTLRRTFIEKSICLHELQTEIVPFLSKLNFTSLTAEQITVTKELGEMNVKRTYRQVSYKPLTEKDVFQEDIDNSEGTNMCLETSDLLNNDGNFSDEDIVIEEYDF